MWQNRCGGKVRSISCVGRNRFSNRIFPQHYSQLQPHRYCFAVALIFQQSLIAIMPLCLFTYIMSYLY